MTTFESQVKQINYPQQMVYNVLSNLENLNKLKELMPQDNGQQIEFTEDCAVANIPPVGKVAMKIIERTEPKEIKFEAANSPVAFNMWIQILPTSETTSKIKLTIKAELNVFIKSMVEKPLKEGLEKIADILALLPYNFF